MNIQKIRYFGGRNSFQAANYVEDNLSNFVYENGPIVLVIWTGTCDLPIFFSTKFNFQCTLFKAEKETIYRVK